VKDGMTVGLGNCIYFGRDGDPSGPQCFMTGIAMAGGKEAMDDGRI